VCATVCLATVEASKVKSFHLIVKSGYLKYRKHSD
jgi:hypothetical protein